MPWRILSGFCNSTIFDGVMALCFFVKYVILQLLLHFSTDFDQTFIEALSPSALAHIIGVLRFDHFWWSYGPLFYCQICNIATAPTFLNGFWPNFHRSIIIKCPGTWYRGYAIRLFLTELWPFVFLCQICNIATTPTFLNGFWPKFHRSIIIKCPGTWCQGYAIRLFLTELWPFVFCRLCNIATTPTFLTEFW